MNSILKNNKWFLLPYAFFVVATLIMLVLFGKNELHSYANQYYSAFADVFFKYITQVSELWGIVFLVLLTLFISYRTTLLTLLSLALGGGITQLLKRTLFSDFKRPSVFFSETENWHIVEGLNLHTTLSFPSGHTTAGFCLFFSLALGVKNKKWGLLFFFLAFLIGYSRVYLSQHYLRDVLAGSLVAIISVCFVWVILQKSKKEWLNKSILKS